MLLKSVRRYKGSTIRDLPLSFIGVPLWSVAIFVCFSGWLRGCVISVYDWPCCWAQKGLTFDLKPYWCHYNSLTKCIFQLLFCKWSPRGTTFYVPGVWILGSFMMTPSTILLVTTLLFPEPRPCLTFPFCLPALSHDTAAFWRVEVDSPLCPLSVIKRKGR